MNQVTNFEQNNKTMSSKEIAVLTDKRHSDVLRDIRKILEELYKEEYHNAKVRFDKNQQLTIVNGVEVRIDYRGFEAEYILNKEMTYTLITGYSIKLRNAIIQRWEELEMKNLQQETQPKLESNITDTLAFVESFSKTLRISEASKLKTYRKVQDYYNLPQGLLPEYTIQTPDGQAGVSSEVTYSLSRLLKDSGSNLSAQKANKVLEKLGMQVHLERSSTSGKVKKFWNLTEKGLKYGKNIVMEKGSERETQPHFYECNFKDLLKMIEEVSL